MKAIFLKGFGGVENLVIKDVSVPDVSNNEVLLKVKASVLKPGGTIIGIPSGHLKILRKKVKQKVCMDTGSLYNNND